jgi:hypothetical protein
VRRKVRVFVCPHQPLFVREVRAGVLNQPVHNVIRQGPALIRGHGRAQFAPNRQKASMLRVDAPDVYAIRGIPLEHISHIDHGGLVHEPAPAM